MREGWVQKQPVRWERVMARITLIVTQTQILGGDTRVDEFIARCTAFHPTQAHLIAHAHGHPHRVLEDAMKECEQLQQELLRWWSMGE